MSRLAWFTTCTIVAVLGCAASASAGQRVAPARYAPGPAAPSLTALVGAMGADASDAAAPRYAYLRKLDSHLQDLATAHLAGSDLAAAGKRDALTLSDGDQRVLVDVRVTGDMASAESALRGQGMDVQAVSNREPERIVEGTLPVGALPDAAGLGSTQAVLSVQGFETNTGSVLSQGDAAHRGPQARALGPTGAGVAVGVISDSINRVGSGVAGSQATGDLPGPASTPVGQVQVLQDGTAGSTDEGRAMAEIIFDTAPGVRNMMFTTGQGAATRAAGIDNLVAHGAKVIADDTVQLTEPFFQDGVVAQAVDRAKAAGVTYLVSAGNRARQSWEGTYAPMTDPRGVSSSTENFGTAAATDAIQTIGTFTNTKPFVSLQWDEPFGHATTDLALDFYTITGGVPTYATTVDTDNIATTVPSEFASLTITGTVTLGMAIRRVAGTRNPFIKYIVGGTPTFTIAEHNTSSDAIDPDAASARGALTVAASNYATPATPESFSSRGPAFKLFDVAGNRLAAPEVRPKPDLAAADGVATSVSGFSAFFGTSAAAPSAAGIAALMLSAKPTMPVDETAAILRDSTHTTDCTLTPGVPDNDCGFGFELADGAVAAAQDASPPAVAATVTPATPNGAGGWYTSPSVNVSWSATDPGSPISVKTGCDPAAVTTDTPGTAFTCAATSAGGTATQSVTIKRDASPPSAPAFAGITPRSFTVAQLPPAAAISCTASDPTSGVGACTVSGFSPALGPHTLTATATNGAGLTSTAALAYSVTANTIASSQLDAISGLRTSSKSVEVSKIRRAGAQAQLTVAKAGTALKVTVTLRGKTVGSLIKTVAKQGAVTLHVHLTRSGRARLSAKPGKLTIKVTGSGSGLRTVTLTATLKTKR